MLSIDEEGVVSHVNPVMSSAVEVPHRRQVLKSLRKVFAGCCNSEQQEDLCENFDTVCRFFGITLEQLIDGQEDNTRQ